MPSLLKESHAFTTEEVTAEYEDRLNEPVAVLDANGVETDVSKGNRFKFYDNFEINDLLLSRIIVESLLIAGVR